MPYITLESMWRSLQNRKSIQSCKNQQIHQKKSGARKSKYCKLKQQTITYLLLLLLFVDYDLLLFTMWWWVCVFFSSKSLILSSQRLWIERALFDTDMALFFLFLLLLFTESHKKTVCNLLFAWSRLFDHSFLL